MTVVRMHVMTRRRHAWTGLLVLSFGTPRRKNIYPPVIHGPHPRTRASKEKAVDVLHTTPGPNATPRSPSLEERIPLVGDLERTPAHNSGCLIHGTNSSTARDERLDSVESPSTARIPARARPRTPAGVERNPAGVHAGAPRGSLEGPGARRARARASVYVRGCGRPGRGSRSRPLGPGLVLPASTAPHARVRTCPGAGRVAGPRRARGQNPPPASCVLRPASCTLRPRARCARSEAAFVRPARSSPAPCCRPGRFTPVARTAACVGACGLPDAARAIVWNGPGRAAAGLAGTTCPSPRATRGHPSMRFGVCGVCVRGPARPRRYGMGDAPPRAARDSGRTSG